jgi:hypothetical protein
VPGSTPGRFPNALTEPGCIDVDVRIVAGERTAVVRAVATVDSEGTRYWYLTNVTRGRIASPARLRMRGRERLAHTRERLVRWRAEHGGPGIRVPEAMWGEVVQISRVGRCRATARVLRLDRLRVAGVRPRESPWGRGARALRQRLNGAISCRFSRASAHDSLRFMVLQLPAFADGRCAHRHASFIDFSSEVESI